MPYLAPPSLTRAEQETLLRASSVHPRDHLILSLALGTGLRLAEIVGLNVGDVFLPDRRPRGRIRLRREIAKGGRVGDVFLPDALIPKLGRFWTYKRHAGESLDAADPLFCNQRGERISKRRVQIAFRRWQLAAGFDHLYPFHARDTRRSRTFTGPRGICSWRRGSRGTCRRSPPSSTQTRATRSCMQGFGASAARAAQSASGVSRDKVPRKSGAVHKLGPRHGPRAT